MKGRGRGPGGRPVSGHEASDAAEKEARVVGVERVRQSDQLPGVSTTRHGSIAVRPDVL